MNLLNSMISTIKNIVFLFIVYVIYSIFNFFNFDIPSLQDIFLKSPEQQQVIQGIKSQLKLDSIPAPKHQGSNNSEVNQSNIDKFLFKMSDAVKYFDADNNVYLASKKSACELTRLGYDVRDAHTNKIELCIDQDGSK